MAYRLAARFCECLQELMQSSLKKYAGKIFGKNIVENEILAIHGKTIRRSEYAPTIPDKKPYEAAYAVSAQVVFAGYVFRVCENR